MFLKRTHSITALALMAAVLSAACYNTGDTTAPRSTGAAASASTADASSSNCPAPTMHIPAGFYITPDGVWHTGPRDQYPDRVDTLTWLPRVCIVVVGNR